MWKFALLSVLLTLPASAAEKMSAPQLIDLAKSNRAGLQDAITSSFEAKDLKEGVAIGAQSIASGAAKRALEKLVAITNEAGAA